MFKKLFFVFAAVLLSFPVHAQSPKNMYKAEYFLSSPNTSTQADVRYSIQLQNPTGKQSSEQFLISLPSGFRATDIEGMVNDHLVSIQTALEQNQLNIIVPLITTEDLKDILNISLHFKQENVLTKQGNVYELLIPTLLPSSTANSSVTVNLPNELQNLVLLSKPMFSSRTRETLSWNQVNGKTIQVFFGKNQQYDLGLTYQIENTSPIPGYVTLTFPPDTIDHQVVLDSISEKPNDVTIDSDGNVLGRYLLRPSEKKEVKYKAKVILGTVPREDILNYQRNLFRSQKHYLLKPFLTKMQNPPRFSSIKSVYSYVLATLSYDYSQLSNDSPRYNHKTFSEIIRSPSNSVCLDYSSLIVSLARQNALYAREVVGYGFSPNEQIRPQSGDMLHSWAEYYDTTQNRWYAVDPTWEDTSKVDYFSALDLNHIALVIRGASSSEPYPAGFYRFSSSNQSKLVSVSYAETVPNIKSSLVIKRMGGKNSVTAGDGNTFTYSVLNTGNVTLYAVPLSATGEGLRLNLSQKTIEAIAPLQSVDIQIKLQTDRFTKKTNTQVVFHVGDNISEQDIKILPTGYNIAFVSSFGVLLILILTLLVLRQLKHG
ncbi:MAG: transglutaminase family protein [Microgenomates group bacterium]